MEYLESMWLHPYLICWLAGNGLAQTTKKYCSFNAALTCSAMVLSTSCFGYELSWVRVVLVMSLKSLKWSDYFCKQRYLGNKTAGNVAFCLYGDEPGDSFHDFCHQTSTGKCYQAHVSSLAVWSQQLLLHVIISCVCATKYNNVMGWT